MSSFPYPLIGMVHLLPLPGSPGYRGSRDEILDRAIHDATILENAGFSAVLIENYGDKPFHKIHVEPYVISEMTGIVTEIKRNLSIPFGVQVLRNDALAALSIAAATGAKFIRVNVHTGVMITDQGIIEGRADETLRIRSLLGVDTQIFADVHVKHARPLVPSSLSEAAKDTVLRGCADAIIISGSATGEPASPDDVLEAVRAVSAPVIVGSGVNIETAPDYLKLAHGVIVGTSIKKGAVTTAPVDEILAARFVRAAGKKNN